MVSREISQQATTDSEAVVEQRQPLMDQGSQVESFKAALRMQETGSYEGDYHVHGKWDSNQRDKSIGAYGIMSKNWRGYAEAAGIPNANWRDPGTQDRVASQMIDNLANRWGGNWGLVAVSWFAGAKVANAIVERYGADASIEQVRTAAGDTVADYAESVLGHGAALSESDYGQEKGLNNLQGDVGFLTPTTRRQTQQPNAAQDIIRARLVALADVGQPEESELSTEESVM